MAALEALADRAGIAVRTEPLDPAVFERSRGGLCKIAGKTTIVVDSKASIHEKIAVFLDSLACVDLDAVYILPSLRARIEAARQAKLA
ncbi:MAG TPA: hypothetical protein VF407_11340 [Polyangiaceae bacterium]